MGYPADNNPGQQGAAYGQYGGQAKGPATSPYMMNSNADDNKRMNDYNHIMSNPNPSLPVNIQPGPDKSWYPGMYPSTQPQFGTNPYSPQTATVSGHPGHNPSTIPAVEPNQSNTAYSNHGQFVKTMASGGGSFSGPAKIWAGSPPPKQEVAANQFPGYKYNPFGDYYVDPQGQKFTAVPNPNPAPTTYTNPSFLFGGQATGGVGSFGASAVGGLGNFNIPQYVNNPFSTYQPYTLEPMTSQNIGKQQIKPVQNIPKVYKPSYAPIPQTATNIDSWGNPLY